MSPACPGKPSQDLVAKVVCEILQAMTALTAHDRADLLAVERITTPMRTPRTNHCCQPFCLERKSPDYCVACPPPETHLSPVPMHVFVPGALVNVC